MGLQLNRLKLVNAEVDRVTKALEKTARKLESDLNRLLAQSKVGTETVDVALARANVQRLMVESGYYEVTGDLLDTTYQKFIDQAHRTYQKQFGKSLQYSDVSMKRLDQIRALDAENFNTIAADNINQLEKVMLDYQFGTVNIEQAAARIAKVMGPEFERYAQNVIRETAVSFDREANNLMAVDAGFEKFEYIGPDDGVTREFCAELIGEVKTWAEWSEMVNEGGYPVTLYGGGVNCRHSLVPTGD